MDIIEKIDLLVGEDINESQALQAMSNILADINSSSTDAQLTAAAMKAEDLINKFGKKSLSLSIARFFGGKKNNPNAEEMFSRFEKAVARRRGDLDAREMRKNYEKFKYDNL
jgi:hypothetical protein